MLLSPNLEINKSEKGHYIDYLQFTFDIEN